MLPRSESEVNVIHNAQRESFLRSLRAFNAMAIQYPLPPRVQGYLVSQLHIFLEYIAAHTEHTVETVEEGEIQAWLEPARGLSLYDLRIQMLRMLAETTGNPALRQPHQAGSPRVRRMIENIKWRAHHRELVKRTEQFFSAITQQNILDEEQRCRSFYDALIQSYPEGGGSGVFDESDDYIVRFLRKHTKTDAPNIVDVGCGRGRLLQRLRVEFPSARLIGTSVSEFREEESRAFHAAGIKPLFCTADRIEVADTSQDIVVSTEVIEHLREPSQLVKEIHRVLKVGGVFCVTAPSKASYLYGPNPLTYLAVAASAVAPGVLPPFHNLYAPLTPLKLIHYGFSPSAFHQLFAPYFADVSVITQRFVALRKFRLDRVAARIPVLRMMGGLCLACGWRR